MKSFFKKVLLFVIDAVTLILAYYVSYYAAGMLGMESSPVLVSSSYIFAAVKIIIYLMFVMYSTKSSRNFLFDVLGIVVANAAACAVAMFLFGVNLMENIVALAIVLVWDMLIGLMLRFLIRNPSTGGYEDEYEDDEDYFAPSDRDKLNNYVSDDSHSIDKVLTENKQIAEDADSGFSDTGSLLSMGNQPEPETNIKNEEEDAAHREYLEKIALLENELKAKEEHIDTLENEMALTSDMDFESFAPSDEEEPAVQDEPEPEQPAAEPPTEDNGQFYGYDPQPYADPYAQYGQYQPYGQQYPPYEPQYPPQQPLQWPQNPYDTNYNAAQNEQRKQKATELYMEQHRQELLDGILKDIKSMYSTLSTKTKSLEEKEYDLLLKYVELDEREKTLAEIKRRSEAKVTAYELEAKKKTLARKISDDMILPSDNLALTRNIKKTLDILQKNPTPPFVLAEKPNEPQEPQQQTQPVRQPAEPVHTSAPAPNTLTSQLMHAAGKTKPEEYTPVQAKQTQIPLREELKKEEKQGIKDASYQAQKLREMLREEVLEAKEKKTKTATSPIERAMQQTQEEMGGGIAASPAANTQPSEILNQIDEIRREIKNNRSEPPAQPQEPDMRQREMNRMYEAQAAQHRAQQEQQKRYTQHKPPYPVQPPVQPQTPMQNNIPGGAPAGIANPNKPVANAANIPTRQKPNAQPAAKPAQPKPQSKPAAKPKPAKSQPAEVKQEKKTPAKDPNTSFKNLETGNLGLKSEEFDNISSLLDDL